MKNVYVRSICIEANLYSILYARGVNSITPLAYMRICALKQSAASRLT